MLNPIRHDLVPPSKYRRPGAPGLRRRLISTVRAGARVGNTRLHGVYDNGTEFPRCRTSRWPNELPPHDHDTGLQAKTDALPFVDAAVEKVWIQGTSPFRDASPVDLIAVLNVVDFGWRCQTLTKPFFNLSGQSRVNVVPATGPARCPTYTVLRDGGLRVVVSGVSWSSRGGLGEGNASHMSQL